MKHSRLSVPESNSDQLVRRARGLRRKGELRRAMLLLRQASFESDGDARLWALYAAACARAGKVDEAQRALGQALYLRERSHDHKRAAVLRALRGRIGSGSLNLRAA